MRYMDLGSAVSQHQNQRQNQEIMELHNKKNGHGKAVIVVLLVLGLLSLIGFAFFGDGVKAIFNPVSVVSEVASANLKETDGRTNVLILGSDRRVQSGINTDSFLTDTILVASIGRVEGNIVMISLPRDLWVESPSGYKSKINAVYASGGSQEMTEVVSEVLGIPIHYYVVVDFELFTDTVDILGGVEVNVENSFTDNLYPIEGKENAPNEQDRYQTISFEAGRQLMDGETALKYVRSRKGDNGEDTDFARSRRQQNLIMAIKENALSLDTLIDPTKLTELYKTYLNNVDTNITLSDAQGFYFFAQHIDFETMRSIVLDDRSAATQGGLLYAPEDNSLYGGAYVLIPRQGNFGQVHAYVQKYVFGE